MIVLLSIYIALLPAFSSIPVDPPDFQTGNIVDQSLPAATILIGPREEMFFGSNFINDEAHLFRLMEELPTGTRIRLLADRSVSMDRIATVVRTAQRAGITEIEFVREVGIDDLRPFDFGGAKRGRS